MTVTTPPPQLTEVALDHLYIHAMNPRQLVSDQMIEDKAASVAVSGLMQNLLGYRDPEQPDQIGIVAGGIRLRGLQKLAEEGWNRSTDQQRIDPVSVLITDDHHLAQAWAAGENIGREALHPADEVRAYAAMRDQGSSPDMIARAFGKSGGHVARRLKLAALPVAAIAALGEGVISLDVARELTLARDKKTAHLTLEAAIKGDWNAWTVRRALTQDTISSTDGRALYVGIPAYLEAGGTMTEDLFSEDQVLHDEALLDKIFRDMLTTDAERLREDGGWAEVRCTYDTRYVDYQQAAKLDRAYREPVDLPEADADELGEMERLGLDEHTDESRARLTELRERARGDYSDETRKNAIMIAYVSNHGEVRTEGPYLKPAPKGAKGDDTVASTGGAEKPLFPANLTEDMNRILLAAVQTAMLDKSELALDLLAYQVECGCPGWRGAFAVTFNGPTITPIVEDGVLIDARLAEVRTGASFDVKPTAAGFAEFQAKGKKHRNTVLTHGLARSINGLEMGSELTLALRDTLLTHDVRKLWTPTAANFFSRVRVDYLDRIWAELLGLDDDDARRAEFARLKKGEKAKELEALFSDASVQEAHGLSRAQVAAIDAWLPKGMKGAAPCNR